MLKTSASTKDGAGVLIKDRAGLTGRYVQAVGRRKTSIARVRVYESPTKSFVVNGRGIAEYFPTTDMQGIALDPLRETSLAGTVSAVVHVRGGGIHSQAEAVRHGLARCLVTRDAELRKTLKKAGFLKRDPRAKERRKFGLVKARKAPQWAKR